MDELDCELSRRARSLCLTHRHTVRLVVTGVSVNIAVAGATIEAVNRGYPVVIPTDCVASPRLPRERRHTDWCGTDHTLVFERGDFPVGKAGHLTKDGLVVRAKIRR